MSLRLVVPAGGTSGPLAVVALSASRLSRRRPNLVTAQFGRVIYDLEDSEFVKLQEPVCA
jgi:hypothetical protein